MQRLKFRQRYIDENGDKAFWHWGFINGKYIFPKLFRDGKLNGLNVSMPIKHDDVEKDSEQFTGMYDKHKKPIYAGDILEYRDNYNPVGLCEGVVEFRNAMFTVNNIWLCNDRISELKVIGTVWQNAGETKDA